MEKHISVLKEEAINGLNIKEDGIYVDMTLGYAGHAAEILKRCKKGFLFAFDKDIIACRESTKKLSEISNNFKIFHTGNINMKEMLEQENITKVDGFIYDLGISSPEIDEKERGFSYMQNARLDMRMNQDDKISAYEVVNNYKLEDLIRIFRTYGEEPYAGRIANNIINARNIKPITTTEELVEIISKSIPYRDKRKGHPAKKVFQAIRIEVNNELNEFETSLNDALSMLNVDGRIVVITFHSLEDRICKKKFKEVTEVAPLVKGMPNIPLNLLPDYELVNKKPIEPSEIELINNPRSKSSKLRIIKRIK